MGTKQAWKALAVAVAGLSLAAAAAAGAGGNEGGGVLEGTTVSPFGFAIMEGSQLPTTRVGIVGFRFSLFSGANKVMYGLSLAVLANGNEGKGGDGDLAGLQLAGLVNDAEKAEFGAWQVCALANMVRGGGGNLVQLSGFYNLVQGPACGVQITGIMNEAGSTFDGVQLAGVCNIVQGDFCGVQLALVNVANATMSGIQVGVINYAETPKGIQLGAINAGGRNMSGLSLGAFNFNTDTSALWPLMRVEF